MSVVYTDTFNKTLHKVVSFLSACPDVSEDRAIGHAIEIIQFFEERMAEQPLSCQICKEAERLGVFGFHEYHKNDNRIIYSLKGDQVIALLFLHQRQSIQKALIDHCLAL